MCKGSSERLITPPLLPNLDHQNQNPVLTVWCCLGMSLTRVSMRKLTNYRVGWANAVAVKSRCHGKHELTVRRNSDGPARGRAAYQSAWRMLAVVGGDLLGMLLLVQAFLDNALDLCTVRRLHLHHRHVRRRVGLFRRDPVVEQREHGYHQRDEREQALVRANESSDAAEQRSLFVDSLRREPCRDALCDCLTEHDGESVEVYDTGARGVRGVRHGVDRRANTGDRREAPEARVRGAGDSANGRRGAQCPEAHVSRTGDGSNIYHRYIVRPPADGLTVRGHLPNCPSPRRDDGVGTTELELAIT
jgi:hypothetical protein